MIMTYNCSLQWNSKAYYENIINTVFFFLFQSKLKMIYRFIISITYDIITCIIYKSGSVDYYVLLKCPM